MAITTQDVQDLSPRLSKADDKTVQTWISIAKPVVDTSGLPVDQLDYGLKLLAAHVGTQLLNNGDNVSTKTLGPATKSYFDWSGKTTDPFLDLYNDLLQAYGLAVLGKNHVHFY